MKVELKCVKYYPSMSEETNCFQAAIYIDGKKAGYAENRGTGGNTWLRFDDREVEKRFEEYAKALPAKTYSYPGHPDLTLEMNGEVLVDDLLSEYLDRKEAARIAREAEKTRKRFAAAGFPVLIEIKNATHMLYAGARTEDEAPKVFETMRTKHRMADATYRIVPAGRVA